MRLKEWLVANGVSYRELAEGSGQSKANISGKVNGQIAWQPHDLRYLHEQYGLSADFVLGLDPNPTGPGPATG